MQCQNLGCLSPATRALDVLGPGEARTQADVLTRRYYRYRCNDHASALRATCEAGPWTLADDQPAEG